MFFNQVLGRVLAAIVTVSPTVFGIRVPRQDPGASFSSLPSSPAPPTVSISLLAINPTAVPLAEITSGTATHATVGLTTSYAPGAQPSLISGAPALPDWNQLRPADYPALDAVPPTDSPEVQEWLRLLDGVEIPDIPPSRPGGCPTNQDRIGNETVCWWTCGQCTRPTDITVCPDPLTWGLSFDDGPSPDTPRLLNYLAEKNLHSTFFVVGSRVLSRPEILAAEYASGHQVSVHTWSHSSLTTLTNEQIVAELGWTAKVIKDVIGVTPNTMRPPYGDIDDRVRAIAIAMGMTPIIWTGYGNDTFDTEDWHIAEGSVSASGVIAAFDTILDLAPQLDTGFIVLAHDIYPQSVDLAVGYILPDALARQNPPLRLMSIIECMGQPLSNSYMETNDDSTNPAPTDMNDTNSGSSDETSGATAASTVNSSHAGHRSLPLSFILTTLVWGIVVKYVM